MEDLKELKLSMLRSGLNDFWQEWEIRDWAVGV